MDDDYEVKQQRMHPRGYYGQPPMNQRNALLESLLMSGQDGTQSGGNQARPDRSAMGSMAYTEPPLAGLQGSQSGQAEESWPMGIARFLQGVGGHGAGAAGGLLSLGGVPEAGVPLFLGGAAAIGNSQSENPQDVWAHQLMQKARRRNRGLLD